MKHGIGRRKNGQARKASQVWPDSPVAWKPELSPWPLEGNLPFPGQWQQLSSQPAWLKWTAGLGLMAVFGKIYEALQSVPVDTVSKAEILVTLIILIVVMVAQEILRPKPEFEDQRPGGVGDFHFVTATEGRPVPIIWGRVLVDGPNCIWYGDISAIPINEEVRTGWFSKERFISGYQYTLGVQFGLCRGPDVELVRVWLGRDQKFLVYDGGVLTGETRFDINEPTLHFPRKGGVQATCDYYPGTSTQIPNEYLKTADRQLQSPMTEIPRYTGTCHIVARELNDIAPLTTMTGAYVGNDTSVDPWSFELQRFPPIFGGQLAGEHLVPKTTGIDCNPMNVIYEILTNTEWGLGFLAGEIDVGAGSSFLTNANTMDTEINGWAFVLDKQIPAVDLLGEVERQIDGIVFLSQATGKWQVKLARNDYVVATLPHFTEDNSEFSDYSRATWEDTTNQVMVKFNKRDDEYKESYAVAQDTANVLMQGAGTFATGKIVAGTVSYPGCKLSPLASNLVWRSLRTRAYPLARAKFTVSREFWELGPLDVFKWSNTELSINELPMRVTSIDFGRLTDNKITITAVQDIFEFMQPSFGNPPVTSHKEPQQLVVAFPADEQLGFEAPRAMVIRDPEFTGNDNVSKILCAGRRQGPEVIFNVTERHHPSSPTGPFATAGIVSAFMRIGALKNALTRDDYPVAAITIESDPDTQANLVDEFTALTAQTLGENLQQILLIGNEFFLVRDASINGLDVDLENVYRGALDSVQEDHDALDDVYLFFAGSSITDTSFPTTDVVHLRYLPQSMTTTLASGDANQIAVTMAQRTIRPYPPSTIRYNGTANNYGTPDLEGDGSTIQNFGIDVDWLQRYFAANDEVAQLGVETAPPAPFNTEYELEVRHTPYGGGDIVETRAFGVNNDTGLASILLRVELLDNMPLANAEQVLEYRITARHDNAGLTDFPSRQVLTHRIQASSTLTGQVAMGKNTWSNALPTAYVAPATETLTVNIGRVHSGADIEYRLNGGGSWIQVIAQGLVTGTFAVTASDSIELRAGTLGGSGGSADGGGPNFMELARPASVEVAYGIFST